MGFKVVLQTLLVATSAAIGGGVLSIWSKIRNIEPLTNDEAYELRNASSLAQVVQLDCPTHRRVFAYRLDGLMPSKHATEQVHSGHLLRRRGGGDVNDVTDSTKGEQHADRLPHNPLSPSLGSLYALHAIEAAYPFRWGWMWRTFRETYRVSDTFNVWWRTRPSWMAGMCATLAETADGTERERLISDAAEAVGHLSNAHYEAILESGDIHGAIICGAQRTTMPAQASPVYGVRFDLPDVPDQAEQPHPHARATPLYVLYMSAPYSSDNPTETWEKARIWKDEWYSRWFAAHVVKALSEM